MSKNTVQTFSLDKKREFVSGLFWQPIPGGKDTAKAKTIEVAKQLRMDVFVHRFGKIVQTGLASTKDGAKKGQYSAAAAITKSLEMEHGEINALIAVPVPGRSGLWLYVAQRDGALLPDGDQIGSEDEIRSLMLAANSVGEWDVIVAPDHWGFTSSEKRFEDFLPKNKLGVIKYHKWWALSSVFFDVQATLRPVIVPLLVGAVALAGWYGWNTWKAKQLRARQEALQRANARFPQAAPRPVHPWIAQPKAADFVATCMGAIEQAPLWTGWDFKGVTCENGMLNLTWDKGRHWTEHLKATLPDALVTGTTASYSVPIKMPPGGGNDAPLPSANEAQSHFTEQGERYGLKVDVAQEAPPPPPLPGAKPAGTPQAPPDWKEITWTVKDSLLPPETLVAVLDGKGFRVTSISANNQMQWTLKGTQYAKP